MILLDTNVLLWWLADHRRLKGAPRRLLSDPAEVVVVSAVSIWEISIKQRIGKLEVGGDLLDAVRSSGFDECPISWEHADLAGLLPSHHRDPFDRMLVVQAQSLEATLMTGDQRLAAYDVDLVLV